MACTSLSVATVSKAQVPEGDRAAPSDFNGDGYADLAIGAPMNGSADGLVTVIPGSATGLLGTSSSNWDQDTPGIAGTRGKHRFGTALASDDFNRDGFADLAVGAPSDAGVSPGSGSVTVVYGSSTGLTSAGNQYWLVGPTEGLPAAGDRFGIALAAGDFDGDGYPDLAVGEPDPGVVLVLKGSAAGLSATGMVLASDQRADSSYGRALAAGDVNADGLCDLIVGAPQWYDAVGAGAVFVHLGSPTGPSTEPTLVEPADVGISEPGSNLEFGKVMTVGDFDADGFGDLALGRSDGVPEVMVVPGSASGPVPGATKTVSQRFPGLPAPSAGSSGFGTALAAGQLSGDAADELVIGVPGQSLQQRTYHGNGMVVVLQGTAGTGLSLAGVRVWTRDSPGVPGVARIGERFGAALAIANFSGSGDNDLAIGAPGQSVNTGMAGMGRVSAGGVTLLPGAPTGVTSAASQVWTQGSPGLSGRAAHGEEFGAALAP
jgi:hypothetical protein